MSASRCKHLPDTQARDSEEKAAHLKAPQKSAGLRGGVQILVLGPSNSQAEPEPREGSNQRKSAIPAHLLCAREGKLCVVYAGTQ